MSLPVDVADAIYTILRETCGAWENERSSFVQKQSTERIAEWRFGGTLGFGGKFWRNADRWYVNYYPEHQSEDRDADVAEANRRLAEFKEKHPDIV